MTASAPTQDDPAKPLIAVYLSGADDADAVTADIASRFLEAMLVRVAPDEQLDALMGGALPAASAQVPVIGIGHGVSADRALASALRSPAPMSHVVLMHPRLATETAATSDLAKVRFLITAGATDPETPPDRVGALVDQLDAAGATTSIAWTRGAADITNEEREQVASFLDDIRAGLVDPATLPVQRIDEGAKGRYVIEAPGNAVAEMTYSRANEGLIIIDHTEVPNVFRGSGTGLRLLNALIADARAGSIKIIPLCPYAAAQFKRHPEWSDLLETKVRVKAKPPA